MLYMLPFRFVVLTALKPRRSQFESGSQQVLSFLQSSSMWLGEICVSLSVKAACVLEEQKALPISG